ncbi:MAG TPA: phytanoyl-CoA dioxygenase family protein [Vicinamibacterales bacterium]|nr:phytanoyl-CoA dioxygenase family protein [Vicinamibacterales bacterium]
MRTLPIDVARQLLKDARLSPSEVEDRLRKARSRAYWLALAPDLHVEASGQGPDLHTVPAHALEAAAQALAEDGAGRVTQALAPGTLAIVNHAVDRVVAAGWPPAFVFVYDEAWWCARAPALTGLAAAVLGAGAWQSPIVWIHHVAAAKGASGWAPHFDGSSRARMNCWIALTDATVHNGCIHFLPRRCVPSDLTSRMKARTDVRMAELVEMLHGAVTMPAAAGDLLAWMFDVVHWGGHVREAGLPPRRSLAVEFAAAAEPPLDMDHPVLPLTEAPPPLAVRLRGIAWGLVRYRTFEPLLTRFEGVAQGLLAS